MPRGWTGVFFVSETAFVSRFPGVYIPRASTCWDVELSLVDSAAGLHFDGLGMVKGD